MKKVDRTAESVEIVVRGASATEVLDAVAEKRIRVSPPALAALLVLVHVGSIKARPFASVLGVPGKRAAKLVEELVVAGVLVVGVEGLSVSLDPVKVESAPPESKPSPDHQTLVAYYHDRHVQEREAKPVITAREAGSVRKLLAAVGLEEAKRRIDNMLAHELVFTINDVAREPDRFAVRKKRRPGDVVQGRDARGAWSYR